MQGGIIDKDMPMPVANVALICPSCDKATRVGYRIKTTARKVRICKKCGKDIVSATETTTRPPAQDQYDDEIRAALKEQLGLANVMEVPRLEKIVINMGVGAAVAQPSLLEGAVDGPHDHHRPEAARHQGHEVDRRLQAPRGQRDRRQGHAAGDRMWEFLDRLDQPGDPPHPRLPRAATPTASTATATTRSASPSS